MIPSHHLCHGTTFILFIISLSDLGTYKYSYLTESFPSCSLLDFLSDTCELVWLQTNRSLAPKPTVALTVACSGGNRGSSPQLLQHCSATWVTIFMKVLQLDKQKLEWCVINYYTLLFLFFSLHSLFLLFSKNLFLLTMESSEHPSWSISGKNFYLTSRFITNRLYVCSAWVSCDTMGTLIHYCWVEYEYWTVKLPKKENLVSQ